MSGFNVVERNEHGRKFVRITELPLPSKPVLIYTSPFRDTYSTPYGTALYGHKQQYVNCDGYTFKIDVYPNTIHVGSGVEFSWNCDTYHQALQMGVKCVNAILGGYTIMWLGIHLK